MSATDELRRLLDERGVEWKGYKPNPWTDMTAWDIDASDPRREVEAGFMEFDTGVTLLRFWNATPEQAIAATLGTGTCKVDVLNTGDCAGYECSEYIMHCNGCGHEFGHVLYNEDGDVWMSERPSFCPNCGREVVSA